MRKYCIIFFLSFIIIGMALAGLSSKSRITKQPSEYFRIHIRANSNESSDQEVKYVVRDVIVAYLTPIVAECKDKQEAEGKILQRLSEISFVATTALKEKGYYYTARATIQRENFPTRTYDGVTLPSGVYDALIVELGKGEGQNWWCVIYPPLCFSGGSLTAGNIVYKSKIAEIIREWKAERE